MAARLLIKIERLAPDFYGRFLNSSIRFSVRYIEELLSDVDVFAPTSYKGIKLQHLLRRYLVWCRILNK